MAAGFHVAQLVQKGVSPMISDFGIRMRQPKETLSGAKAMGRNVSRESTEHGELDSLRTGWNRSLPRMVCDQPSTRATKGRAAIGSETTSPTRFRSRLRGSRGINCLLISHRYALNYLLTPGLELQHPIGPQLPDLRQHCGHRLHHQSRHCRKVGHGPPTIDPAEQSIRLH